MPEDTTVTVVDSGDNVKTDPASEGGKNNHLDNLKKALDAERIAKRDLQTKLDELSKKDMEEKGKYKDLYESEKTEKEKLKKEVDGYTDYFSKTLEEVKKSTAKEIISLVPESLSPQDQINWIQKAEKTFKEGARAHTLGESKGMLNPAGNDARITITQEEYLRMPRDQRLKYLDQAKEIIKEDHRKSHSS